MKTNLKKSGTYAKALFELDSSPEFLKTFLNLAELLTKEKAGVFFNSLSIPYKRKKEFLEKILSSAPSLLKNFFLVLLDNNKSFFLLPEIVRELKALLDDKHGLCRAEVSSPYKLSSSEKLHLKKSLGKFFNKKIELEEKEDKSLIAGLSVSTQNYLFKGHFKHYLEKFSKAGGL